jgi:hypothetical protein
VPAIAPREDRRFQNQQWEDYQRLVLQRGSFWDANVPAGAFNLSQWMQETGTWVLAAGNLSNSVLGAGNPLSQITWLPQRIYQDAWATMSISASVAGRQHQILFRWNSPIQNGYYLQMDNGANFVLRRVDAGVSTDLVAGAQAYGLADVIGVRGVGSLIEATINGVVFASATDATYPSGSLGLGSSNVGNRFDAWAIIDRWQP